MNSIKCQIKIPDKKYHNDILHPCIRYSSEKILGYNWWLILSPWYKRNDKIENPLLFYGIQEDEKPPLKWYFYKAVKETPEIGYNSDPSIAIFQNKLYAFWREVETKELLDNKKFSAIYSTQIVNESETSTIDLISTESNPLNLTDLSPEIIINDSYWDIYTIYHKKTSSILRRLVFKIGRIIGINYYSSKTIGLLHRRLLPNNELIEIGCYPFNMSTSHIPWHFDILNWENNSIILLYCEFENNIYIGKIDNGKVNINSTPLTQNISINDTYKPTGIIIQNILWLYYTDKNNPSDKDLNELYRISFNLKNIFHK